MAARGQNDVLCEEFEKMKTEQKIISSRKTSSGSIDKNISKAKNFLIFFLFFIKSASLPLSSPEEVASEREMKKPHLDTEIAQFLGLWITDSPCQEQILAS
jgi:hypothetical protein